MDSFDFGACQRPDGSIYGTSGACRKGRPISLRSKEGVLDIVKKAKEAGLNDKQIKQLADAVRAKHEIKQLRAGRGLESLHRRINERIGGEEAPPQKKKEPAPKAKPASAKSGPDEKYGAWGHDQLMDRLRAAKALGHPDESRIRKEILRRMDGEERKAFVLEEKKQDLQVEMRRLEGQMDLKEAAARRKEIKKIDDELKRMRGDVPDPSGWGPWAIESAKNADKKIAANITSRVGQENYPWEQSRTTGAKALGQGAFGSVTKEGGKNGNAVKRGDIGVNEARIMGKVGAFDLGPRMVSAELDGPGQSSESRFGRIAMTVVPGRPLGNRSGPEIEQAYWTARANLHRLGVAHNDMHIDNVFMDKTGKGRFVDMGMAQDSPKAALAEAMGVFKAPIRVRTPRGSGGDGDWQALRWRNTGGMSFANAERSTSPAVRRDFESRFPTAAKVLSNKEKAISKLKSFGLDDNDVAQIMTHGIRSREDSFYAGAMGKLTDQQAMAVIHTLYDGI